MAIFLQASYPSTSAVGSASAYPFSWASFSTVSKSLPSVLIFIEHIVGGSVEDSRDLVDLIRRKGRIQRADDGDAAPAACLKKKVNVSFSGDLHKLRAMFGNQRLVGSTTLFPDSSALFTKV